MFGGTVLKLGTERHHEKLLEGIDNLNDIGCFGLTELGYGNNAVEMETTAVYDKETGESRRKKSSFCYFLILSLSVVCVCVREK